jgi:hypothetical protein
VAALFWQAGQSGLMRETQIKDWSVLKADNGRRSASFGDPDIFGSAKNRCGQQSG